MYAGETGMTDAAGDDRSVALLVGQTRDLQDTQG
jgi:hypothetical protein